MYTLIFIVPIIFTTLIGYLVSIFLKKRKDKYYIFVLSLISAVVLYFSRSLPAAIMEVSYALLVFLLGYLFFAICAGLAVGSCIDIVISDITRNKKGM